MTDPLTAPALAQALNELIDIAGEIEEVSSEGGPVTFAILGARLRAAAARLRSAETRPQWQPMETAQQNGGWVLAVRLDSEEPERSIPHVVRWGNDWSSDVQRFAWTDGEYTFSPTHWMPLPSAPEAAPREHDEFEYLGDRMYSAPAAVTPAHAPLEPCKQCNGLGYYTAGSEDFGPHTVLCDCPAARKVVRPWAAEAAPLPPQGERKHAKRDLELRLANRQIERWAICPDHRDKGDGSCIVCKFEATARREAAAAIPAPRETPRLDKTAMHLALYEAAAESDRDFDIELGHLIHKTPVYDLVKAVERALAAVPPPAPRGEEPK